MVAPQKMLKPGLGEWVRAAEVLADRLTECVRVYKNNTDVFMAEAERQHKTDMTIKFLQRLHSLLDQTDMPAKLVPSVQESDEQIIKGFEALFHKALKALPWLSDDMQKLLKSPWMKGFPGKVAESLFLGNGEEGEGIGSGCPEHGRLPAVLFALLDREKMGETRPPREELPISGEPRRHDVKASVRWVEQNAGYLRTAGKVQ
jgi:hypothetical protein